MPILMMSIIEFLYSKHAIILFFCFGNIRNSQYMPFLKVTQFLKCFKVKVGNCEVQLEIIAIHLVLKTPFVFFHELKLTILLLGL